MFGAGGPRKSLVRYSLGIGSCWLGLVGCGSAERGPTYCDVQPLMEARCVRCHAIPTQHGAPFSLATYASLRDLYGDQVIYESVSGAVSNGTMPPVLLDVQPPVEPLSEEEVALINEWALAGAPSGGCQ